MRRHLLLLLALVLLLTLLAAPAALAHSSLTSTIPTQGAVLDTAPHEIVLQFSGKVSLPAGGIHLMNESKVWFPTGQPVIDPGNPGRVTIPLPDNLLIGSYTLTWHAISADGHPLSGTLGFGVGTAPAPQVETGPFPLPPAPVAPAPPGPPSLGVTLGSWLTALGLLALTGLSLMQGWLAPGPGGPGFLRLLRTGWAGALAGTLLLLAARTAELQGSYAEAFAHPPALWQTLTLSNGPAMLARLLLLGAALPVLPLAARRWQAGAAVGALGLLTLALGGHAVTTGTPSLAVTLDWLHLLAASAWVGGLLQFAFLLRGPDLGAQVRRFSGVAAVSVAVLAGTGLYPALIHVPSGEALQGTVYGTALLTKLLLVLGLLLLGAANMLVVGPALRRGESVSGRFRWLVLVEVALAAGVLGATAVMSNAVPARQAMPPKVLYAGIHSEHHELVMIMAPLETGTRTLDLWVNAHEGAVSADTKVILTLEHTRSGAKSGPVTGRYIGKGIFRFEPVELPLAGPWTFRVEIDHPGGASEPAEYEVDLPAAP
jgi:copper transport protein